MYVCGGCLRCFCEACTRAISSLHAFFLGLSSPVRQIFFCLDKRCAGDIRFRLLPQRVSEDALATVGEMSSTGCTIMSLF